LRPEYKQPRNEWLTAIPAQDCADGWPAGLEVTAAMSKLVEGRAVACQSGQRPLQAFDRIAAIAEIRSAPRDLPHFRPTDRDASRTIGGARVMVELALGGIRPFQAERALIFARDVTRSGIGAFLDSRKQAMTDQGQIKAKREAAARARRLALQLTSESDRTRALEFAAELDAEADALEHAVPPHAVPPTGPRVTQIQMQVQQAAPLKDEDGQKDDGDKNKS
jgi:hypothetical protein